MGDEGLIDLDPYGKLQLGVGGNMETVYEQPQVGHEDSNAAFAMPRMQAYCDQMQAFIDEINGTRTGAAGNPIDGRAGVAAVLGMLESSNTQQLVTV
jgi:hypothetical protein